MFGKIVPKQKQKWWWLKIARDEHDFSSYWMYRRIFALQFGIDNLGVKPIVDRNVMQKLTKHIKWHNQAATNVLFIDKNRQNGNQ